MFLFCSILEHSPPGSRWQGKNEIAARPESLEDFVEQARQFEPLSFRVNRNWNWTIEGGGRPSTTNVGPYIGTAMRQNKHFRVLVASGYYDFATPFFGAENSMARNSIVPERVTMTYYEAGHMMYVHAPSLKKLNDDVRAFVAAGAR